MITRLEAFISAMVFMMPGFMSPMNSMPEEIPEHWSPTSYVQQMFNANGDYIRLCDLPPETKITSKQLSFRLPIESTVGEIVHKDWQYFVIDSNVRYTSNFSQIDDQSEKAWSITDQYIADAQHNEPGVHCVTPLQSPWTNKPSYVM